RRTARFRAVMDLVEVEVELAPERYAALQKGFFNELSAAKGKDDVARVTAAYLDRLVAYINANPKNEDVRDATRQVITIYESLGKTVEGKAWRDRLEKAAK